MLIANATQGTLLKTLGFCGILETEQHKGPFHEYVNLGLASTKVT